MMIDMINSRAPADPFHIFQLDSSLTHEKKTLFPMTIAGACRLTQ